MIKVREWLIGLRGSLSQQEVADKCGISQNFYSWIELGERRPSVENAKKIAAVLNFDWTRFFEDANPDLSNKQAV